MLFRPIFKIIMRLGRRARRRSRLFFFYAVGKAQLFLTPSGEAEEWRRFWPRIFADDADQKKTSRGFSRMKLI